MKFVHSLFSVVIYLGLGLLTQVVLFGDLPMRTLLDGSAPLSAYAHILAFPLYWLGIAMVDLLYFVAGVVACLVLFYGANLLQDNLRKRKLFKKVREQIAAARKARRGG